MNQNKSHFFGEQVFEFSELNCWKGIGSTVEYFTMQHIMKKLSKLASRSDDILVETEGSKILTTFYREVVFQIFI